MVDWPEQQAFNPNRRQISLLLVNEFEPENQLPVKEFLVTRFAHIFACYAEVFYCVIATASRLI